MFYFIWTMIVEIVTSLTFNHPLHFMSIVVVLMLFTSPGAVATILASGVKLGAFTFWKEEKAKKQ